MLHYSGKLRIKRNQRFFKSTYLYNTYYKAGQNDFKKFVCCVTLHKVLQELNSFIQEYGEVVRFQMGLSEGRGLESC